MVTLSAIKYMIDNQILELEQKKYNIIKKILNCKFTSGKYTNKLISDIIIDDFWYVVSYLLNKYPNSKYSDICYMKRIQENIINKEQYQRELKYESKRFKSFSGDSFRYQLDYEIRHNCNLRDFGM